MKRIVSPLVFAALGACLLAQQSRVGDVVTLEGVQDNVLVGIGLVIGLDGTGDGDGQARQLAANFLQRGNVKVDADKVSGDNIALVYIRAELPPFKRAGDKLDVVVGSMGGKTKSLYGGILVETPLTGPDLQTVYAVAGGAVVAGVQSSGASGSKEKINHPTVGRITNGAKVEREVPQHLGKDGLVRLKLRENSFASVRNLAQTLSELVPGAVKALDAQTVEVKVPPARRQDLTIFVSELLDRPVTLDPPARVVIDANTGTITVGAKVVLLPGAIAHGSISISIQESPQVSQPGALSNGTTTTTQQSTVKIDQRGTELRPVPAATSAADVAKALNALGLTPRELITVFQSLKANGLLAAELVIQ
jgi:flagellar P-ring protein precursor FlgI